ncbi:MAG: hypothetical protein WCF78_02420 [archaeon]
MGRIKRLSQEKYSANFIKEFKSRQLSKKLREEAIDITKGKARQFQIDIENNNNITKKYLNQLHDRHLITVDLNKMSPRIINLILLEAKKQYQIRELSINNKEKKEEAPIKKEAIRKRIIQTKPLELTKENIAMIELLATKDASIADAINVISYFNGFKTSAQKFGFIYYIKEHPSYKVIDIMKKLKMRVDYLENVENMLKRKS